MMEKRVKNLLSCTTCNSTPNSKGKSEQSFIKKWFPNICIGHIAMAGAFVYILVSELIR